MKYYHRPIRTLYFDDFVKLCEKVQQDGWEIIPESFVALPAQEIYLCMIRRQAIDQIPSERVPGE